MLLEYVTTVAIISSALIYSNILEWFIHKHILHGLGKNKNSFWSFHWHDHHKNARKSDNYDEDYLTHTVPTIKEKLSIFFLSLTHIPVAFVSPIFYLSLLFCSFNYLRMHKKAHLDIEWGKRHMPHHYDHHMGANQDANWCVTYDWFDRIVRTRIRYEYLDR
jgi:hypothetical protein